MRKELCSASPEKPPSQTPTEGIQCSERLLHRLPICLEIKHIKFLWTKLRRTDQTAPFRTNYEIIDWLASAVVCYCFIIRAFEISLFQELERQNVHKCMNFQRVGTQTHQLNDSFPSNVRLSLLCFQKEQPPEVFYKKIYC